MYRIGWLGFLIALFSVIGASANTLDFEGGSVAVVSETAVITSPTSTRTPAPTGTATKIPTDLATATPPGLVATKTPTTKAMTVSTQSVKPQVVGTIAAIQPTATRTPAAGASPPARKYLPFTVGTTTALPSTTPR